MAATTDGTITIGTRVDTAGVSKGIGAIKKSLSGLASAVGVAFSLGALVKFGKEAIELASNLTEVQNVVDTAFGKMSYKIEEFSKTCVEQFGISELTAKSMASTFMAMGTGMGQAMGIGSDMAVELTGRLADVASFYNKTTQQLDTIGRAIYSGETEPLKALGIVMTETNLEAFALAKGYGKLYKNMSASEKLLVRQKYFLEQTALAEGDFYKTQDSWANQTRILQERWKVFLTTLGSGLITVFTPLIKFLNQVMSAINRVTEALGTAISLLFGLKKQTIGAAESAGELSEAEEGVASSVGKAGKKAKGSLASFDKLNVIQSNSGAGASGGTTAEGIEDVADSGEEAEKELTKLEQMCLKLKSVIDELGQSFKSGFLAGLGDAPGRIENIKSSLERIKNSLLTIFTDTDLTDKFIEMLNKMAYASGQIVGAFTSIGITIGQLVLGGIADFLEDNSDFITKELSNIFSNIGGIAEQWGEYATALADIFSVFGGQNAQSLLGDLIGIFVDAYLEVYDIMTRLGEDVLTLITQPFIDNKDEIKTALDGILGVLDSVAETIRTGLIDAFQEFNTMYEEHISPLFQSLTEGLSEIYNQIYTNFNEYILPILNDFATDFSDIWDEYIQPVLSDAIDLIGTVADAIKELWEKVLQPLIEWYLTNIVPVIVPYLKLLWSVVSTVFKGIMIVIRGAINHIKLIIKGFIALISGDWEGFWNSLSGIVDNIMDTVQKLLENYTSGYAEIFTNLWETLKGIINMILSGVETLANGVVGGLNKVFEGFDKIGDKEIKNPFTGESTTIGFSIPQLDKITLPRLATGAVIPPNKQFMAILGDQKRGTNIEAPLDTIKQAMAETLASMNLVGTDDRPIVIQIDGREVFRAVRQQGKIYTKSTGKPAFN